jgi:Tfp pilus assembly protein PilN
MTPIKGRVPLKPPVQHGTAASARPLLGFAERRAALLANIEQSEAARAAELAQERTNPSRAPGGSRQRRIRALQRENEDLRKEIAELKQFLIELGSPL